MNIFALSGRANCGKTETLCNVIKFLDIKYPGCIRRIIDQKDKKVLFLGINGWKVGIETQGDPNSRLKNSLADFCKQKCDIVFCACRSRGATVSTVKAYQSSKNVVMFIKQTVVRQNFLTINSQVAKKMISLANL